MKEKVLSMLLALVMVFGLLPGTAWAAASGSSGACGDNLTWTYSNRVLTIEGTGPMWDYTYGGNREYYNYYTTTVIIGDGVTSIGNYAFSGYVNLTSLTIPDSVTSIREGSFYGSGLTSVTIPNSVTSIKGNAFGGCRKLASVTIPVSVTSIEEPAFGDCDSLTDVYYGGSKAQWEQINIGNRYNGNDKLLNATIHCADSDITSGELIGSIDGFEIDGNGVLIKYSGPGGAVTIPGSVTKIDYEAFDSCTNVTSVVIPDSVKEIVGQAFPNCTNLTSVTIGNGVPSINDNTFVYCTSLKNVTIGSNVTAIYRGAFAGCASLTNITIGAAVTVIVVLALALKRKL